MRDCMEYLPEISLSLLGVGACVVLYDQFLGIENKITRDQCPDRSYKVTMAALVALSFSILLLKRLHFDRARRKWVSADLQKKVEDEKLQKLADLLKDSLLRAGNTQSTQNGRRFSINDARPSSASADDLASR